MSRILIVEDEPSIAMALEDDLRCEGYETVLASDGDEALRLAIAESFDLMLLDVMLPGKDGFDVCRDVRRAGRSMPIVLLTAKAQEAEKVLGLELGADDYVTKPYSPRELRARIKAHLRRQDAPAPDVYQFGDAELDLTRCELRRAGRVVELSALEFKLLVTFVTRAGRVLSRTQLLDEVWGSGTHVTDRVVDNQVTNLRKKIEPTPDRPRFLVSLRGLGYRFDV
ncbi:MAG: DNA-binding response regulator [Acidobacteria bacterium RIFCSPLOWO2_02_FULL_65_29]|nr:MAG: DNA-binding response regulator [Acidobacteria bacterium RIFCSPLOWO2_02_FULL_65_29]